MKLKAGSAFLAPQQIMRIAEAARTTSPSIILVNANEEWRLLGIFDDDDPQTFCVRRHGDYITVPFELLDDDELTALAAHRLGAKGD